MRKSHGFLIVFVLALFAPLAYHHPATAGEMAAAAENFLTSLGESERRQVAFDFADEERFNFHFIPRSREGVPFKSMTPAQRKLAHALLAAGLSSEGYMRASTIMFLEQILWEMEGQSPRRDPELYFFSVFGSPSLRGAWGWRVEGHHLSLNFTLRDGRLISSTPMFFGANPAEVRHGPHKGLRILSREEDLARELLHSLSEDQYALALIDVRAPADILTGNQVNARLDELVGLTYADMTDEQRGLLVELIELYARRLRSGAAEEELMRMRRSGLEKIHFAWAGGPDRGDPHYYRIHSPEFVIEYDNVQDGANHIHTVWRDFRNDFGRDLLGEHRAHFHREGHPHTHSHPHSHPHPHSDDSH